RQKDLVPTDDLVAKVARLLVAGAAVLRPEGDQQEVPLMLTHVGCDVDRLPGVEVEEVNETEIEGLLEVATLGNVVGQITGEFGSAASNEEEGEPQAGVASKSHLNLRTWGT